MGIAQSAAGIVLVAGLAGCATDPGNGLRYADGSYYSPVGEGRGDYYVGREVQRHYYGDPFFDEFFWLHSGGPWYGGWYGSPFYGYGGYCSVRYRYCPRGWADPFPRYDFSLYFGDPWNWHGGYGSYGGYDPWRRPPPRPRPRPTQPRDSDDGDVSDAPRPAERPPPRRAPRPPRDPMAEDRDDGDVSAPRRSRGGAPRREDPPPPPRSEVKDDI
jgi:hypothetical protein